MSNLQSNNLCQLLRLPRELRDIIYSHVFESSRLRHGLVYENAEWVDRNARRHQPNRPAGTPQEDWVLTEKTFRHVRPAPNTLALLSTCRQVYEETVNLWPRRVTFAFDTLETMIEKLSRLPRPMVEQIRHVQVSPAHTGVKRYPMASMIKVVPGLNLDTLTVVMSYASRSRQNCQENMHVIDDFVSYGVGWRKLYYLIPDTLMLTSIRHDLDGDVTRPAQPAAWIDTLSSRDWDSKQAAASHVRVYKATDGGAGAVFDPARRERFVQKDDGKAPAWMSIEDRIERKEARSEEAERLRAEQRGDKARELMVVVERRRGQDVVDDSVAPYNVNNDFRAWMGGKSWAEYWTGNHHITAVEEPVDAIDSYESPADFEWVASERKGVTWPVRPPPRAEIPTAPSPTPSVAVPVR